MNKSDFQEFSGMTVEASHEMHGLMSKVLKAMNGYFDAPEAAKVNLLRDVKIASNVLSAFARIRQSESGHELVILAAAKMVTENKKEAKDFMAEHLPQLTLTKKLTK